MAIHNTHVYVMTLLQMIDSTIRHVDALIGEVHVYVIMYGGRHSGRYLTGRF